jgi:RNA polymerase sigma factor (sigma-70 family)
MKLEKRFSEISALIDVGRKKEFLLYDEVNNMLPAEINAPEEILGLLEKISAAGSPLDKIVDVNLKRQTHRVLDSLARREQEVLRLRYGIEDGEEHTLENVGGRFALTRERIRQIEAQALRKLRYASRAKQLTKKPKE